MNDEHKKYLKVDFSYKCNKEWLQKSSILILNKYGAWMDALTSGKIEAYTEDQNRFISMHNGKNLPITNYEYAWFDYRTSRLYQKIKDLEGQLGTSKGFDYQSIVSAYCRLASVGHSAARDWLHTEGIEYSMKAKPFHLSSVGINEILASNERGRNYASGYSSISDPNHTSDRTDWSDTFDDMSSETWEKYLGGS